MSGLNITSNTSLTMFILIGIPGLEDSHFWIAFLLCFVYVMAIMGNCTIVFIIKTESSLHEPMYFFLAMLAALDILLVNSVIPKMLGIFWFNAREISFNACLVQMFCIHFLSAMESTILVAMAFDRYVAICNPLRHASILTSSIVAKIGLVAVIRAAALMAPGPCLITRLSYCSKAIVLSHSYCLHQDVMKFSCADITVNVIFGLCVMISSMGLDSLLIFLSYFLILRAVLRLSWEARLKVFSTCISHLCAVLIFYIPFIGLSMVHRFGKRSSPIIAIVMANVYLLVPPVMNPMVYGIKTKQIRQRIMKAFHRNTTGPELFD
ncbi:olfactory receptor 51E1-like [Rhinatrema bivittatum]|uniref:olfactory receptor 51E1-like n=1 Tax=Rhinatrema bivittatum TaxID=194408 RepID=UPI0011292AF5|nr:olfactory receptor 51E1-like [Rhinatrema bivittatum]